MNHTDDPIRLAFHAALSDPTGASDEAFCREMLKQFVTIFAEEMAREMANKAEAV